MKGWKAGTGEKERDVTGGKMMWKKARWELWLENSWSVLEEVRRVGGQEQDSVTVDRNGKTRSEEWITRVGYSKKYYTSTATLKMRCFHSIGKKKYEHLNTRLLRKAKLLTFHCSILLHIGWLTSCSAVPCIQEATSVGRGRCQQWGDTGAAGQGLIKRTTLYINDKWMLNSRGRAQFPWENRLLPLRIRFRLVWNKTLASVFKTVDPFSHFRYTYFGRSVSYETSHTWRWLM